MDKFIFDDSAGLGSIPGGHWYPWKRFQTKTANYTLVATDNYSRFDNVGATGAVTFTLPAIANGYYFGFSGVVNQNIIVASFETGNIVALNTATANSVAFQTSGQIIGANFIVYSNAAGTKWFVQNESAGVCTVTVV